MKKLVIALICVLVLTGCGSGAGDGPQQSDLPVETSNTPGVYDGEITLDFSFGTRTGNYSGEIDGNGLPSGQGKFTSKNSDGETWTYEGEWTAGHWEGTGTSTWASGQVYTGEFSNDIESGKGRLDFPDGTYFDGIFTDGSNASGFVSDGDNLFYAKMIDGNINVGGIWRTGEFGDEISAFQGEWQLDGDSKKRVIVSGESINFVRERDIGSKHFRDVTTFYFGFDENNKLIVVNEGNTPRYDISINEDGVLSIVGGSKDEHYEKVSDSIEIPVETKEPEIGMSANEVYASTWGAPQKKNTTSTAYGTHEQWVYEDGYIYFEDGIVTAIQD